MEQDHRQAHSHTHNHLCLPSFCRLTQIIKPKDKDCTKKMRSRAFCLLPQTSKYVHPSVSWLFFRFRTFSAYILWAIPEPGLVRCGWFSSARRDCGPFLKTAALFYTCLFLSGWLDWRAEINITWRRSLHVQCSGAESLASLPWLLKGVGHLPCPEGQTHTCMHTQIQPADSFPSTAYQDANASSTLFHQGLTICVPHGYFSLRIGSCIIWRRSLLLYMVPYVSRGDWQESWAAMLPHCGFPILLWLLSFFCSLVYIYILNVCWKFLTS